MRKLSILGLFLCLFFLVACSGGSDDVDMTALELFNLAVEQLEEAGSFAFVWEGLQTINQRGYINEMDFEYRIYQVTANDGRRNNKFVFNIIHFEADDGFSEFDGNYTRTDYVLDGYSINVETGHKIPLPDDYHHDMSPTPMLRENLSYASVNRLECGNIELSFVNCSVVLASNLQAEASGPIHVDSIESRSTVLIDKNNNFVSTVMFYSYTIYTFNDYTSEYERYEFTSEVTQTFTQIGGVQVDWPDLDDFVIPGWWTPDFFDY
ncbi:MAG: hypothetical protein FWB93_06505 [Oscillospiraceae bacterium]|nr:hypothetical protein [Oscillospiraceae bacterium]